ncbi:peptidoglycan-recognition protein 2-like isoform X2 [Hermetia illucens]|nr:peptidoglycan-recognition protein 2-like isoform X2 [Hermetia illucens]
MPAKAVYYQTIPVRYVVIHHTATRKCNSQSNCSSKVASIQRRHMNDKEWHDIGYNFLIGGDGNIYEGIGWNKRGAHTSGFNDKSIGIAFIGNFNEEAPKKKSLNAAKALLSCGVSNGYLSESYRLIGARQVRKTSSPGSMLYDEIQEWDNWVPKII